jgi:hypothetical protein
MAQDLKPVTSAIDHLLLGVADLDRGIDSVDKRLGVHAAIGGVHSGAGTRFCPSAHGIILRSSRPIPPNGRER